MPSIADWLTASWGDFRRRWAVLFAVAGTGGGATLAAGLLPFVPAALASLCGVRPAWAVWSAASLISMTGVLWLSTWAQAAALRAVLTEETARECLASAWGRTAAFAWVLSLALLAVGGGYFLFVVPGLLLSVLFFAAPFCSISEEAQGARALGLSWARVKPHFGAVAARLFVATAVTAAPGWIPYVGWIVMLFWAPFGFVALARLDKDLRAAEPQAAPPDWMGSAVAGLSCVFLAGTLAAGVLAVRAVSAAVRDFDAPGGLASRVRPETAQAVLNVLSGQASDEQKKKAYEDLLAEFRGNP